MLSHAWLFVPPWTVAPQAPLPMEFSRQKYWSGLCITWNDRLDESQAGIKTAGRNINNLRYANDTTLVAESKEELKSLFMRVKEEGEKVGLKLNVWKTNIMVSGPATSWQIDG